MKKLLGQFSINQKFIFLIGLFFVSQVITTAVSLDELRHGLLKEREQQIQYITETVASSLQGLHNRATLGEISSDQAQKEARALINAMRYGANEYVMVFDRQYNTIIHPVKPSLNGKNLGQLKDVDGVFIVKEMVNVAVQNQSGVVGYKWPKAGSEDPVEKLSYAQYFDG